MTDVAEQADTLQFAQEVVSSARARTSNRGESSGFLEPDRLHALATILLRRLKEKAAEVGLFAAAGDQLRRVVYWIETTGSAETTAELKSYLSEILVAEAGNAGHFLRAFTGRSQGGSGIIGFSDYTRATYTAMADLLDPALVYAQLRELHGPELDDAVWEQDWGSAVDIDNRLARQFSAIHRNPALPDDAEA